MTHSFSELCKPLHYKIVIHEVEVEAVTYFILLGSKILGTVIAAMK